MRDADDLRVFGDAAQLDADLIRRFAADAGVNLIEDLRFGRAGILRQHGVDGEHNTRKLAAGCNFRHRLRILTCVCGDEELDAVAAEGCQRCALLLHGENDAGHVEL